MLITFLLAHSSAQIKTCFCLFLHVCPRELSSAWAWQCLLAQPHPSPVWHLWRLHLGKAHPGPLSPRPEDASPPAGGTGNAHVLFLSILFFHGLCSSSMLFFPPLPSTLQPHLTRVLDCAPHLIPGFLESRARWAHSTARQMPSAQPVLL